ncbi:MAG TPA: glycoside hydrolase family 3 C-terminal domain-containing protein [Chitinivibrionales bacterium]|nr:glycoside hydrolase family 3 C-terminal domain-containing protein [Chitinivibrionales bacterium]
MLKKAAVILLAGMGLLSAQPASTIDTVLVTPVFLKLVSTTGNVYKYVGKVSYELVGWSNDRFNASLSIIQDGSGAVVPITSAKGDGYGNFSFGGIRGIFFTCQFNGAPTGTYKAKVSVAASQSDSAKFVENLINTLSNGDKQTIINGGSAGSVPAMVWQDGPYGDRGGYAYPAGEGMAATFDTALAEVGGYYKGQDFRGLGHNVMLGPTMNLVRDGRGGRTFESYGEDPYVNGKMGAADCRGCTKSGLMVTVKHFCCNNEERARGGYPSTASERSLRELYTYHFGIAGSQGPATGFMTAYNNVNGIHCPENKHIVTDILKNAWGSKGFVLTDWDNGGNHTNDALAGTDLPTPDGWGGGLAAMVPGTISQGFFDDKARRCIWARYMTHCFEPGYTVQSTYADSIDNATHYAYMRGATRESMVLVKNNNNLLPIDRNSGPVTIACVGTYANSMQWFISASSLVNPKHLTSAAAAIKKIGGNNVTVTSNPAGADYAVVAIGPVDKGEGNDRVEVSLGDSTNNLVKQTMAACPNTIVFYCGGSCADSGYWSDAPAIIAEFFAGEDHTLAFAEVLFGDYNPAGRLPFTFPADSIQLPVFGIGLPWNTSGATKDFYEDPWEGRGYHYFDYHNMKPLFAFGRGLSYTTFAYSNLQISPNSGYPGDTFHVSVDVKNTGTRDGDEVVQLYLHDEQSAQPRRVKDLRGFSRVPITAGQTKTVDFGLVERDFEYYDTTQSAWVIEPGAVDVLVGAASDDIRQTGSIMFY